ncbi:disulfide bond formation protein B [Alphaproteobacteria bacterium GH1-50]|uniref:Disulfide bond formation protein B n=1 Tax=Kangsaoukella pontilimi TaxID=2691042 RepID=A0A7C9MCM1_9RHOB|nr:disulfide bond formation protein B [Kangsaoukella pontilimi]
MTRKNTMLLAAGGSLALLLGAFFFQAIGYAPCKLCIWQRWPHGAAIAVGAIVLLTAPLVLWALAGALSAATSGGIGIYHTGVERGWWEGPSTCTGGGNALGGMSGADLLSLDVPVDIVMCDEVAWAFLGLSMASWNALASFALAALWLWALGRPGRAA